MGRCGAKARHALLGCVAAKGGGRARFQGLTAPAPFGRGERSIAQAPPDFLENLSRPLSCLGQAFKLCWIAFFEPSNGSNWLEKIPTLNFALSSQLFRVSGLVLPTP